MSARAKVTTPSDREIRIERVFDAPRSRVWRAMTERALVARWWGRGHPLVVERMEPKRGGHWRFVEQGPEGTHGFEGRYREVAPEERIVRTFEWDGMPGHVIVESAALEDLGDGRTKLVNVSLFHTTEERDGMLGSGMEDGVQQSYDALDEVLAAMDGDGTTAAAEPLQLPPPSVNRVAFTMYPVTNVPRAREFYEKTLGLSVGMAGGRGDMYWIEYDLPGGGCMALTNTTGDRPSASAGGTIALEVQDLTRIVERLKEKGVEFKSDVIKGPRCRMAVCLDSEGNSILLHQLDRAKPA